MQFLYGFSSFPAYIRESVDSLCRDGADTDTPNFQMKRLIAPERYSYKPFQTLWSSCPVCVCRLWMEKKRMGQGYWCRQCGRHLRRGRGGGGKLFGTSIPTSFNILVKMFLHFIYTHPTRRRHNSATLS